MEHSRYVCDICKSEKGHGGHWMVVIASPARFCVIPWDLAYAADLQMQAQHVCGRERAHKLLSQWLEANSRPAKELAAPNKENA